MKKSLKYLCTFIAFLFLTEANAQYPVITDKPPVPLNPIIVLPPGPTHTVLPTNGDTLESQYNRFINQYNQNFERINAPAREKLQKDLYEAWQLLEQAKNRTAEVPSSTSQITSTQAIEDYRAEEDKKNKAVREKEEAARVAAEAEYKRLIADYQQRADSYYNIVSLKDTQAALKIGLASPQYGIAEKQINSAMENYGAYIDNNPDRSEIHNAEIKTVVLSVLNQNGIVKEYAKFYPKLEGYEFKLQMSRKNKFYILQNLKIINKALHIVKNSYSPSAIEKAGIIIENSLKADELMAKGEYLAGGRYHARGTSQLTYLSNSNNNIFARTIIFQDTKKYFDIDIKATTYENQSIIELSNQLAKKLNKNFNNENLLIADLNLKEAQYSAKINDDQKFESDLDRGWAFVDFLTNTSQGVGSGLYQVVYDTVAGVYSLATNPVDSALAISSAIYHYDHTWNFIANKIHQDINRFPNLTTEEKAKFITESAVGLATLITPRGFIKNAADLEKIARASHFATTRIIDKYSHLIPPGGHVPLVTGTYGLFAHEGIKGGHLIQKHVGWSDAQLKQRAMENIKIDNVSSFKDLNIAEQAVVNVIQQNKGKIDDWIIGNKNKLIIDSIENSVISTGRLYNKNIDNFSDVYKSRVVMVKDSAFSEGYRIVTGFPIK
jgi:Bacterial CdiA-CT RNAse A domain